MASLSDEVDVLPIAPFESSLGRSRRLPWIDLHSGDPIALDWHGAGLAGLTQVLNMDDFIGRYATHPEAKAAGPDGLPCTAETRGLLGRLDLLDSAPVRVGKEIDRLDEGEGVSLLNDEPICYAGKIADTELMTALNILRTTRQKQVATDLAMSERRWRDISQGKSRPHKKLRERIMSLAARYASRLGSAYDTRSRFLL